MTVAQDIRAIRDALRRQTLPQEVPVWGAYPQDFQDITLCPFTPVAGTTQWTLVRAYAVPAQKRAVVRYFGMTVPNLAANVFIRWRFLVNGSPMTSYQGSPVNFVGLSQPGNVWIQLDQENTVALEIGNVSDTAGWWACTRFVLWTWDAAPAPERGRG